MNRTARASTPWLRRFHPREEARTTVVLFPHAGGAAGFYRDWSAALPADHELWIVQYPGRENRLAEPLIPHMDDLADGIAAALEEHLPGPYVLFGHSMGSLVAYETLLRLRGGPAGAPGRLFVSGRGAPGGRDRDGTVHLMGDDALAGLIAGLGATPPGVLADPEIRALVLPIVRNDYRLVETYRPSRTPVLDVPITALAGADDPTVAPRELKEWSRLTERGCDVRILPGDHFFPVRNRDEILRMLTHRPAD